MAGCFLFEDYIENPPTSSSSHHTRCEALTIFSTPHHSTFSCVLSPTVFSCSFMSCGGVGTFPLVFSFEPQTSLSLFSIFIIHCALVQPWGENPAATQLLQDE